MRTVLIDEICKERPNKAAIGAFNALISGRISVETMRGVPSSTLEKIAEQHSDAQINLQKQADKAETTSRRNALLKLAQIKNEKFNKINAYLKGELSDGKGSKYGLQKDGTFRASNLKQFGKKIEAMYSQKNPSSVSLMNRDGSAKIKVEKHGTVYVVTRRYSKSDIRQSRIPKAEFEKNYNWHLG